MGAQQFIMVGKGKNAQDAFNKARDQALHDYGHAGYSGTIAEKSKFVKIDRAIPVFKDDAKAELEAAERIAEDLLDDGDSRVDDKWGPAGCLFVGCDDEGMKTYVFFGYASS